MPENITDIADRKNPSPRSEQPSSLVKSKRSVRGRGNVVQKVAIMMGLIGQAVGPCWRFIILADCTVVYSLRVLVYSNVWTVY